MTYKEAVDFLFTRLPVFHFVGSAAYKPGFDNTYKLADMTGNPQVGLTCIHVAGTNGKGSVSHMLASIFQEMGWKVGLFTSPHLKDFRERIKVNGKCIPQKDVVRFIQQHEKRILKINPSFFELTTIMAFDYFAKRKTDIAIIETGMGGRLDSSNIVLPELSVITNISFDHAQFLGNTLAKIAGEKAGIIKPGVPVVIGETKKETKIVFETAAKNNDAAIYFAEKKKVPVNLKSELKGTYQQKNFRTVLMAIEALNQNGYTIPSSIVKKGIANVITNTGLQGRWQTLSTTPLIIADIGHNEDGIKQVVNNLKLVKYKNLFMVIGFASDKDINKILAQLPRNAEYCFTQADNKRAMPSNELLMQAHRFRLKGNAFLSVKSALNYAKKKSGKGDLIFVGGSAYVVAEVLS